MADDVTYKVNGEVVTPEEFRSKRLLSKDGGVPMTQGTRTWPLHSIAMGCHSSQVSEFKDKLRAAGCPTEYDNEARPILKSKEHRKEVARVLGYFDKDAGYGDPAPTNF